MFSIFATRSPDISDAPICLGSCRLHSACLTPREVSQCRYSAFITLRFVLNTAAYPAFFLREFLTLRSYTASSCSKLFLCVLKRSGIQSHPPGGRDPIPTRCGLCFLENEDRVTNKAGAFTALRKFSIHNRFYIKVVCGSSRSSQIRSDATAGAKNTRLAYRR